MRKTSFILAGVLALTACDGSKPGEPTVDEMKEVVGANIKAEVDSNPGMLRGTPGQTLPGFQGFSRFDKLDCTEVTTPAAGWSCRFNMTIRINGAESSKEHTGFFARGADGKLTFTP